MSTILQSMEAVNLPNSWRRGVCHCLWYIPFSNILFRPDDRIFEAPWHSHFVFFTRQ